MDTASKSIVLKYGNRGEPVRVLQKNLKSLGFESGAIDGIFGRKTQDVVTAFQKRYGLKEDGIVGSKTQAQIKLLQKKDKKKLPNKKVIKSGATLICSRGTAGSILSVPINHGAKVQGRNEATVADRIVGTNIKNFGICRRLDSPIPCDPVVLMDWKNSKTNYKIGGYQALTMDSILPCFYGGKITIQKDGQRKTSRKKKVSDKKITIQLSYGSRGANVAELQENLKKLNCYFEDCDGLFGRDTKAAVLHFQKKYGLKADGIAGRETKDKIFKLLKKKQKKKIPKSDKKVEFACGGADNIDVRDHSLEKGFLEKYTCKICGRVFRHPRGQDIGILDAEDTAVMLSIYRYYSQPLFREVFLRAFCVKIPSYTARNGAFYRFCASRSVLRSQSCLLLAGL